MVPGGEASAANAPEEPRLAAITRPLLYAAAAWTFALPLSTQPLPWVLSLWVLAGALAGRSLARSRLRTAPVLVLCGLCSLAVGAARTALLDGDWLASWLGPSLALRWANGILLGAVLLGLAAALRALALRRPVFRVLEVGLCCLAFAQLVAAHRGGAINRPFELADSIIAAGGDPAHALLAIGAVAATLAVLFLLGERNPLRALGHLLLVALLLLSVVATTRLLGLPRAPASTAGMGLRPDEQEGKKQQGKGQQQKQERPDEAPDFRDNYDSPGRQVPLAVVLLHDDYSPPGGMYYFRQNAFSQYNGRRLVASTQSGVDSDLARLFAFDAVDMAKVPNAFGDRRALDSTVALLADHNHPFALESPQRIEPLGNPDPGRFRRVYRARSLALESELLDLVGRPVGDPAWPDRVRSHYLETPPDSRYAELGRSIIEELPEDLREDPVARALMVADWLGREGIYSLRSGHASERDPTASFLFGNRTGYCVHFSHAATYLMRGLGIPSRVATGYAFDEAARQGGSTILLSGANAHAWPEVFIEDVGWVVMDIAPERALDGTVAPPDADLQRMLGEMARGLSPLPPDTPRPFEPAIRTAMALPALLGKTLLVLVPTLLLLLYTLKLWRRLAPAWGSAEAAPRLHYRAQIDRLSELSIRRRHGESQEAFAARLSDTVPSLTPLTASLMAWVFGGHRVAQGELRQLSRAVGRELRQTVPLGRRLRAALDPFGWLRSR